MKNVSSKPDRPRLHAIRGLLCAIAATLVAHSLACNQRAEIKLEENFQRESLIRFSMDKEIAEGPASEQDAINRLSALEVNYKLWLASQPVAYKYKYIVLCDCLLATINMPDRSIPIARVAVNKNEVIITGFYGQRLTHLEEANKGENPIDRLFTELKKRVKAEEYMVVFEPKYGYPQGININQLTNASHVGLYAEIFNIEAERK